MVVLSEPTTTKPKSNLVHIGGLQVEFPYQPYGSQLAYMSRVISTLDRAKREGHFHALLESPTGTGKSLSLLCSALAWQKNCGSKSGFGGLEGSKVNPQAKDDPIGFGGGFVVETQPSGNGELPQPPTTEGKNQKKNKSVPTIFYASRTHTQISQVVREYRKTAYRVPMSILASRKHYCTNELVSGQANIDEQCKLLLKNKEEVGCMHFKNAHKVKGHPSLQKGGCHEVHDIEDLVKVGKVVKGCSYYAARSMADDAQLVFCPYNYVISPVIRRAMEIDITKSVVILDEAHNIEDIARDAGSINVEQEELLRLRTELEQLCLSDPMTYQPLVEMIQEIISWMDRRKETLEKRGYQHYFSCWSGEKSFKELKEANISPECFPILQECATKAIKAASDADQELPRLSGTASMILEGLFSSLTFFFSREGIHVSDYELALQRKRESGVDDLTYTFSLWCLNPSVVFREIADLSLSVILTSGTLSPMNSFSSELGIHFGTCLEAPHIIDIDSQLWTAVIPKGPGNYNLNASYKTADAYVFQDELGESLEAIFKVVPGGCLVFFPSYKLMEKLCSRWKVTGQWSRLKAQKFIFVEPRGGNQENDFEPMLKDYYNTIRGGNNVITGRKKRGKKLDPDTTIAMSSPITTNKGAAFLAVCRGKVSEGVDFSDEFARVVIIVGIPFLNVNDIQVAEKKKFNDTYKSSKNLLSGNEWYCHQAFRALNQATGRCIRHKFDYGAIIYLDERFCEDRNRASISKWFRKSIKQYDSFETSLEGLKSFFRDVKNRVGQFSDSVHTPDIDVKVVPCVQDYSAVSKKKTLKGKKTDQLKDKLKSNGSSEIEHTNQMLQTSYPLMNSLTHIKDIQERSFAYENGSKGNLSNIKLVFDSDEESRMCDGPLTEQSPLDPDLIMVKETPCSHGEISVASPESVSTNQNTFLSVQPSTTEIPEQFSDHFSLINTSPDLKLSSLMVTPERKFSSDVIIKEVESDSPFNWSVNSHVQKRRKSYGLSAVNHSREEQMGYTLAKTPSSFHRSPRLVMDQRLRINCSICKNPLGLPENNLLVTCIRSSSSKVYLKSLWEASLRTPDVPVVICDVSSVDQRICNRTSENPLGDGIWCKEDGCVFKPIFCPLCCDSHNSLGVQVMATDASNVQLQDKILFYSDRLVTGSSDTKREERNCCSPSMTSSISNRTAVSSIEKFAYSPPEPNSGGWRTTNSRLRQQKRGLLSTSQFR
ncbi:DNA helicase [Lithospermum erythrorhizon]|uniref:DNA 5'-3' helicase FANCJ n=1 Tax=Lithospermum erythrorhizon TaxID=34254 RepID=A0AAV3NLQ2_LITER